MPHQFTRQIAECEAALEHAQRQRDGLALLALTDPRKEKALADAEVEVQRHQLQRQRLDAAQRAAAVAAVAEDNATLQKRLDAALQAAQATALLDHVRALDAALDAAISAAGAIATAGAARRDAVHAAARVLGQLVPQASSTLRSSAAAMSHLADGSGARDALISRLTALAGALGLQVDFGTTFTLTNAPIAEIVASDDEALRTRLAGWTPAVVRAAVAPVADHAPAHRVRVVDGVSLVVGSEVEAA